MSKSLCLNLYSLPWYIKSVGFRKTRDPFEKDMSTSTQLGYLLFVDAVVLCSHVLNVSGTHLWPHEFMRDWKELNTKQTETDKLHSGSR